LREDDRTLGIDAAGDQRGRHFAHARAPLAGIHIFGERMKVGEEIEALGFVLHSDPAQDGADQIAEVQSTARLNARDDACGGLGAHVSRVRPTSNLMSSSTNAHVKKQAIPYTGTHEATSVDTPKA